jgi:hypothetical protein
MRVGICWCAFTVWIAYPLISWLSVLDCPCAFRMLIDRTLYLGPSSVSCLIALIADTTRFPKKVGSALMSLLDMEVCAQLRRAFSPRESTLTASLSWM